MAPNFYETINFFIDIAKVKTKIRRIKMILTALSLFSFFFKKLITIKKILVLPMISHVVYLMWAWAVLLCEKVMFIIQFLKLWGNV